MSQSSTLTRCPHCETRFRVTEEQLGIARGKVRCGHCMEVFNARDHAEPDPAPSSPATESKPSTRTDSLQSPPNDTDDILPDDDLVFEDDPEEDAVEGNYAGSQSKFQDDELSDSFLSFDEHKSSHFDDSDDDLASSVDESWAEAMLADDRPPARPRDSVPTREPPPSSDSAEPEFDPTFSLPVHNEPEPELSPRNNTRPEPTSIADKVSQDFEASLQQESATPDKEPESDPAVDAALSAPVFDAPPPPAPPRDDGFFDMGDEPSSPYHNLRSEPVALSGRQSHGGFRRVIWSLLAVALVAVLIAQVTYFQVDRLSSIPELRPYYEKGCDILGCKLPQLVAIDRIQSQKLVVRTDPKQRSTLIVDAVIINRAEFEQPFPGIGLTFSNLNGDVVAQSLFEPDEYLAGDAKDSKVMPTGTPVRISITIRDPGRDAVNYNISFVARGG